MVQWYCAANAQGGNMDILLPNIVQFPSDAESNSFFGALSSALLPALGYTERTPYWCSPRGGYCVRCGKCGESVLPRHHLSVYHVLLTVSGAAFGFAYPEDDDFFTLSSAWRRQLWPDSFLEQLFSFAGLGRSRFAAGTPKRKLLDVFARSLDAGIPVPVRLGGRKCWQVVTGLEGDALVGLDSHAHTLAGRAEYRGENFVLQDWYSGFADAVVPGPVRPRRVGYRQVLEGAAGALSRPRRALFRRRLFSLLGSVREGDAQAAAEEICRAAGVPVEARWHAAEAFCSADNLLSVLSQDGALKDRLHRLFFERYIRDGSGETHGVCWKIWGLLGCGESTGLSAPEDAGERLLRPGVRGELGQLWRRVFENDEAVLAGLRQILSKANQ